IYEMCTARAAFSGSSRASIITAIMSREPTPISSLQPLSPPALEHVVQACLAKDPEERCQTAHDVRLQLEWIRDAGSQAGVPRAKSQRRITWKRIAWASMMLLLLAIATISALHVFRRSSQDQQQIIFRVEPPPGYKPDRDGMTALSPDGTQAAYAAADD